MIQIRPFRNDDLPALLRTYRSHWAAVGVPASVNAAIIERAFLSRPDFDRENLLVAHRDNHVLGWCQMQLRADADAAAVVTCLCFAGENHEHHGDELLAAAEARTEFLGLDGLRVGARSVRESGLYGLSPIGGGIGIPVADTPTSSLLSRRSYRVAGERLRIVADPTIYRPPIDRDILMLRRSTRIEQQPMVPRQPHIAAATSHLDLLRYHLVNHRDGQTLGSVDVWLSDLEVALMEGSRALLDLEVVDAHPIQTQRGTTPPPPTLPAIEPTAEVQSRFLIASAVQSLAARSIFHVEATVAVDSPAAALHQSSGLTPADRGRVWFKNLGHRSNAETP